MSSMLLAHKRRQRRLLPYYVCAGVSIGLCRIRSVWSHKKSSTWWDDVVLESFTEQQWLENFRMGRRTFDMLCRELNNFLKPCDNFVRDPVDVKKQVAITIYFLASSSEYRTIGNLFGVSKSMVCKCVHKVCYAIVENLLDKYVNFPSGDDLRNVIEGYEGVWGFPNCGGAIDGCHIPIKAPEKSHGDYLNRKGWYSLVLQGVCDYKYTFTDINIGWPGRVHDARVFANSEIYHKGEHGNLFPNWVKKIILPDKETNLPVTLLADPAYPLKPWILKPYSGRGHLTASQTRFNYRLSRARMTIENSFGRLKGRWRCLQKRLDVNVVFACIVIAACVILHNICEMNKDVYENRWDVERDDQIDIELNENNDAFDGKTIRDDLASAFENNLI